MKRFVIAALLIVPAALLIAYAGGADVLSPASWAMLPKTWALPSTDQNERCLAMLAGMLVLLMSLARLLTPGTGAVPAKVQAH